MAEQTALQAPPVRRVRPRRHFVTRRNVLGSLSVLVVMVIWQFLGTYVVNPLFLSTPIGVLKAAAELIRTGELWTHLYISSVELLLGFGLSLVVGIPFGILTGWYRDADDLTAPFVSALYATPRLALMPLILIWLGIGLVSKVAVIFLSAVFPMVINTYTGVRNVDKDLLKAARVFGATDFQMFSTIVLPASVPYIISGAKHASSRAIIGVFVAEMTASMAGIGNMITQAGFRYQTDVVFVGVAIFSISGITIYYLLDWVERQVGRWYA